MKNFQQTPRERRKAFSNFKQQLGQSKTQPRRTFAEGWSGKRRINGEPVSRLCRVSGFDVYYDHLQSDHLFMWR